MIKHGVDANSKADDGKTALMYAAKNGDVATIKFANDARRTS